MPTKETEPKQDSKESIKQDKDTKPDLFAVWLNDHIDKCKKVVKFVNDHSLGPNAELALLRACVKPLHFFKQEQQQLLLRSNSSSSNSSSTTEATANILPQYATVDNMLIAIRHKINKTIPELYKYVRSSIVHSGSSMSVYVVVDSNWSYSKEDFKSMCALARGFGGEWVSQARAWVIPVPDGLGGKEVGGE